MNEAFERIKQGLEEAIAYAEGKPIGAKVFQPTPINVKEVRQQTGLTQAEFARTFGISLGTLRHWERGDRKPHGPALVLLHLVAKEPQTILRVLYQ